MIRYISILALLIAGTASVQGAEDTPLVPLFADETQSLPLDGIARVRALIEGHAKSTGQFIQIRILNSSTPDPAPPEKREIHITIRPDQNLCDFRSHFDLDALLDPGRIQKLVDSVLRPAVKARDPERLLMALEKTVTEILTWSQSPAARPSEESTAAVPDPQSMSSGLLSFGLISLLLGCGIVGAAYAVLTRVEIHISSAGRVRLNSFLVTLHDAWFRFRKQDELPPGAAHGKW